MILGETRKQVIVVTGTKQEAKVLARADVEVLIAGNDQAALAQQLAEVAPRAAGFVSFGMAGAIDRTLRLGQWLIARRVSGPHAAMADEAWVEALKTRLPGARLGSIYADGRLFATQQDKVEQSATSAAMAVDMESHLVAQIAQKTGVPFVVLRCISDLAGVELPPAVGVMINERGNVDVLAMLKSLAAQPGQTLHLARTLRDFARAYRELERTVAIFGARLAFDAR